MTSEEKKIFDGVLFKPGDPELRQIKLRSHNLCAKYNRTTEDEVEYRAQLLEQILGGMGKGVFMQGPIFFHYGTHTTIGDKFFGNYNLTIQDDGKVTIGNNVNFGPNVTIVTPMHPLIAEERNTMLDADGNVSRFCGNDRQQRLVRRKRNRMRRRNHRRQLRDRRGQRGNARHTRRKSGRGRTLQGNTPHHRGRQHGA